MPGYIFAVIAVSVLFMAFVGYNFGTKKIDIVGLVGISVLISLFLVWILVGSHNDVYQLGTQEGLGHIAYDGYGKSGKLLKPGIIYKTRYSMPACAIAYVPDDTRINIDKDCEHWAIVDSKEDGLMLYRLHNKPPNRFVIDDSVSDLTTGLRYKSVK